MSLSVQNPVVNVNTNLVVDAQVPQQVPNTVVGQANNPIQNNVQGVAQQNLAQNAAQTPEQTAPLAPMSMEDLQTVCILAGPFVAVGMVMIGTSMVAKSFFSWLNSVDTSPRAMKNAEEDVEESVKFLQKCTETETRRRIEHDVSVKDVLKFDGNAEFRRISNWVSGKEQFGVDRTSQLYQNFLAGYQLRLDKALDKAKQAYVIAKALVEEQRKDLGLNSYESEMIAYEMAKKVLKDLRQEKLEQAEKDYSELRNQLLGIEGHADVSYVPMYNREIPNPTALNYSPKEYAEIMEYSDVYKSQQRKFEAIERQNQQKIVNIKSQLNEIDQERNNIKLCEFEKIDDIEENLRDIEENWTDEKLQLLIDSTKPELQADLKEENSAPKTIDFSREFLRVDQQRKRSIRSIESRHQEAIDELEEAHKYGLSILPREENVVLQKTAKIAAQAFENAQDTVERATKRLEAARVNLETLQKAALIKAAMMVHLTALAYGAFLMAPVMGSAIVFAHHEAQMTKQETIQRTKRAPSPIHSPSSSPRNSVGESNVVPSLLLEQPPVIAASA